MTFAHLKTDRRKKGESAKPLVNKNCDTVPLVRAQYFVESNHTHAIGRELPKIKDGRTTPGSA